jgi:hypothetical protein
MVPIAMMVELSLRRSLAPGEDDMFMVKRRGSLPLATYLHEQQKRHDAEGEQRRRHLPPGNDHILSPHSACSSRAWAHRTFEDHWLAPARLPLNRSQISNLRLPHPALATAQSWPQRSRCAAAIHCWSCGRPQWAASHDGSLPPHDPARSDPDAQWMEIGPEEHLLLKIVQYGGAVRHR